MVDREMNRPYRSFDDPQTLSLLVENLPAAVYITNEAGEILDVNRGFLELFGLGSRKELDELDVSDLLVDPERRRRQVGILEEVGEVREFELRIRRVDGEERTVLDTCYRVRDEETGESLYHGVIFDISDRKELEERLRTQSFRDPLTGCYNRRYLGRLAETLEERESESWAAIVVDIDHFKRYNDRFGHAAGDDVLVRIARTLLRQVRAEDAVIRIGGDEFLVLLLPDGRAEIRAVVERLEREKRKPGIPPFSLGCAVRRDTESLEETIRRADAELLEGRAERRFPGIDRTVSELAEGGGDRQAGGADRRQEAADESDEEGVEDSL